MYIYITKNVYVRGPFRTKHPPGIVRTRIVHTSGTFVEQMSKNDKTYLLNYVPIYSQRQRIRISYSK